MLNCHKATQLMSQAQERELSLQERLGLKLHTGMCAACRNFGRQMPLLRQISREYVHHNDGEEQKHNDA